MTEAGMIQELVAKARDFGLATAPALEGLEEEKAARLALQELSKADFLGWTVPKRDGGHDTRGMASEDAVSVRILCALRETPAVPGCLSGSINHVIDQGRVTDHRINLTLYKLDSIVGGDIQDIIDALKMAENAEKLKSGES